MKDETKKEREKEKDQSSSLLGRRGRLFIETRPVGGRIPNDQFGEWEDFKGNCAIVGLKLSPDGMLDMLKTYNKIYHAVIPVARELSLAPVALKADLLVAFLSELEKMQDGQTSRANKKMRQAMEKTMQSAAKTVVQ